MRARDQELPGEGGGGAVPGLLRLAIPLATWLAVAFAPLASTAAPVPKGAAGTRAQHSKAPVAAAEPVAATSSPSTAPAAAAGASVETVLKDAAASAPAASSTAQEPSPAVPATPPLAEADLAALWDRALAAHAKADRREAAALLYSWLRSATRTAPLYDSAQHLLAEELQALGLTHAALVYELDVVRTRTRPELLPLALERAEAWTRDLPHDEGRLEEEVLHNTDFGFLEGAPRAYVAFHQGALDLKAGNERWAGARFAELPPGSPWRPRARLLLGATLLQKGGPEAAKAALAEFEAVAADTQAPRDARNEARTQAARLRFEQGEVTQALAHHAAIDLPDLDPGRGQLYLEQAWARYRQGDGSRAMGLLAALDAPSFRGLFLPEKFLLRALIFKDACHWLPAKRAARALLRRFGPSLEAIRERRPLASDPELASAALQKGAGQRAARWVAQLARERAALERSAGAWEESGLQTRLAEIYALEQAEAERRRQLELERGVVKAADELLASVEQVGLVDYEVGLALYRRQRGSQRSPLAFVSPEPRPGEVAFGFDGEYWNDELPNLRFALTDKCAEGVSP